MDTRSMGSLEVSVVGLGCNSFGKRMDEAQTAAVVAACLDAGVTFFDTADVYGNGVSEEYLGRSLGSRRDEVVIATKFGFEFDGNPSGRGASSEWIEQAVEGSLRRLGTDYIDLYQLHTPDEATPVEETLGALDDLVTAGKVREIGCSNFSVVQIDESRAVSAVNGYAGWVSVQNQYSLLHREPEDGVLDACAEHGLGFLPYFPLHAGLLTGKYRREEALPAGSRLTWYSAEGRKRFYNTEALDAVERLDRFCASRGRTLLELAFSWLLSRDVVASVIAGATRPEHVAANAAAASWELTERELAEVDALLAGAG